MTKIHEASPSGDGLVKSDKNPKEQTGPSMKATKSDDAEVNEQQWDV